MLLKAAEAATAALGQIDIEDIELAENAPEEVQMEAEEAPEEIPVFECPELPVLETPLDPALFSPRGPPPPKKHRMDAPEETSQEGSRAEVDTSPDRTASRSETAIIAEKEQPGQAQRNPEVEPMESILAKGGHNEDDLGLRCFNIGNFLDGLNEACAPVKEITPEEERRHLEELMKNFTKPVVKPRHFIAHMQQIGAYTRSNRWTMKIFRAAMSATLGHMMRDIHRSMEHLDFPEYKQRMVKHFTTSALMEFYIATQHMNFEEYKQHLAAHFGHNLQQKGTEEAEPKVQDGQGESEETAASADSEDGRTSKEPGEDGELITDPEIVRHQAALWSDYAVAQGWSFTTYKSAIGETLAGNVKNMHDMLCYLSFKDYSKRMKECFSADINAGLDKGT